MKSDVSRRSFIKKSATLVSGLGLLSTGVFSATKSINASNGTGTENKIKYGMVIDNTKCIACGQCQVGCRARHEYPEDEDYIKLYKDFQTGTHPNIKIENLTAQCNHCENAPCARICPTQATYINEDGIMVMDSSKCIGCKGCIAACPYNARIWSEKFKTPAKCNFCDGYVQAGKQPACVEICPVSARTFGDLNDEESEISKMITERRLTTLRPSLGTKPKIYYVRQQ